MDDVIVNKSATIERCLARVREEYGEGTGLDSDVSETFVRTLLQRPTP